MFVVNFNDLALGNTGIQVNDQPDVFTNCHQFTRAVILEAVDQLAPGRVMLSEAYITALQGSIDTAKVYMNMVVQNPGNVFTQPGCAAIPSGSLVIFVYQPTADPAHWRVQHTLLVNEADSWIGANNTYNLGTNGAALYPGATPNTGIYSYQGISRRQYIAAQQGGWGAGGDLYPVMQEQVPPVPYSVYHMQVFQ